jgi:hypothetical protein
VGSGYVGTVTGVGFAELGTEVFFVDFDQARVDALNGGGEIADLRTRAGGFTGEDQGACITQRLITRWRETFSCSESELKIMSVVKNELVPIIIIKEIFDQKRELERILSKHKVKEPEEIEKGIEDGKLPEHPTYEDFLSALALRNNLEEMKKLARDLIREI